MNKNTAKADQASDLSPAVKPVDNKLSRIRNCLFLLVFAVIIFAIYSNTLNAPFIFDDVPNISENRYMQINGISMQKLHDAGFKSPCSRRPVANISFALNYYMHGYNVTGFHVTNILIHILTGMFLFFLVKDTLVVAGKRSFSPLASGVRSPDILAFFAVLLWLVHPLHTQSVTYIVQRMASMAAMFYMLSMLLYVRGRITQGIWLKTACFAGSVLAGVLAVGSKELAATLPVFIFLYEWFFFQDLDKGWLKKRLIVVFVAVVIVVIIGFVYLGLNPLGHILKGYAIREFTLAQRVMTESRIILLYISLIFFPYPGRLNLDYDFPLSLSLVTPPVTLLSLFVILGLLGLAVYMARKDRLVSFAILWFFGNLVIESSVIALELVYEHRTYLPSMFVIVALVLAANHYIRTTGVKVAVFCIVAVVFSVWTYQRNSVWTDEIVLWGDCAGKSPNKARVRDNYGLALAKEGRLDEARFNMELAVGLDPDDWRILSNIGRLYMDLDEPEKAIHSYTESLKYKPGYHKAYMGLGAVYEKTGELDKAINHFSQALRLDPENAGAYYRLGLIHAQKGKTDKGELDKAIHNLYESLRYDPGNYRAYEELGSIYADLGDLDKAIESFSQALRLNPENAWAYFNLGVLMTRKSDIDKATEYFLAALKIDPEDADAHCSLGVILMNQGKVDDAIDHFNKALMIDPESADAGAYLRNALNVRDKLNRDIEQLEKEQLIKPHDPKILHKLAVLYSYRGEQEKALEMLLVILEVEPDNPDTYYNIACIHAKQGRIKVSIEWLEKAVLKGFQNRELIRTDPDLSNIRNTAYFKKFIKDNASGAGQ